MALSVQVRLQRIEKRLAKSRDDGRLVYADPLFFARHSLGFTPDSWQEQVLSWTGHRLLLNCCRQSGKSVTAAVLALHYALHWPRSLILLVSPSLRQSSELFKKLKAFLNVLPVRPALNEDNRLSLEMANGSRVVSLPATEARIRGFSGADLIVEDESARVPDELYLACRPMLAVSNGRLILMSTPWGTRGHFFEAWENGGPSWARVCVTAAGCPRISPEFLAEERRTMPRAWYDSEYNCLFTDTVDSIFSSADIAAALSPDVQPLFPTEVLH